MISILFKIYAVLAVIFGIGMLFFMAAGPVGMSKLFAIGLLWCAAGIFVNSGAFVKLSEKAEGLWKKRE